jgi:large conductance mechanosensitive channel
VLKGFKDFILRGNLVELATAFIVGGAFATVVSTFTAVVLSVVAKLVGANKPDMSSFHPGDIPLGAFLTALIAFLIIAAVVYFLVVTPYNALQARMAAGAEATPPSPDIALLTEIRDLLADRPGTSSVHGGGGLS